MTEEQPEWHESPFNWKAILFVVIGLVLLVVAIILVVNTFVPSTSTATATISLRTSAPCNGICH
jgi:hypothetical protein